MDMDIKWVIASSRTRARAMNTISYMTMRKGIGRSIGMNIL
jgi:hypothetical protein